MLTVYKRMAELTMKKVLTKEEETELKHCLILNSKVMQDLAKLENLSYVAFITEDTQWQHEICAQIDDIYNKLIGMPSGYHTTQPKKNKKKDKKEE